MRPIILLFIIVLAVVMVMIPVLFVTVLNKADLEEQATKDKIELKLNEKQYLPVSVYRTQTDTVEVYPLEEYVRGVIAAEMPTSFEMEALKAQALAARTYIVKRILDKNYSDVPSGAMVSDSVKHQVFLSNEELKQLWGLEYQDKISKLNLAVNQTSGQVITYNDLPITALFFSTSNGFTINSEDYWGQKVPYLKSVASPWDYTSPKYEATTTVSFSQIQSKLGIEAVQATATNQDWIQILGTTTGQSVDKVQIGSKTLTGREIRELFGLNSASFTITVNEIGVNFQTKGYGHGVGLSQYGANGMAKEGKKAEDIIKYYYTGVRITDLQRWVK